jgi:hypothetical protein
MATLRQDAEELQKGLWDLYTGRHSGCCGFRSVLAVIGQPA